MFYFADIVCLVCWTIIYFTGLKSYVDSFSASCYDDFMHNY